MDFDDCDPTSLVDDWFGNSFSTTEFQATNAWFVSMIDFAYACLRPLLVFKEIIDLQQVKKVHCAFFSPADGPKTYSVLGYDGHNTRRELTALILDDFGYFNGSETARIYDLRNSYLRAGNRINNLITHFLQVFGIRIINLCGPDRMQMVAEIRHLTRCPFSQELKSTFVNQPETETDSTLAC